MNNDTCNGPECTRKAGARSGLCAMHTQQMRRIGELKPLSTRALAAEQRFWAKVDKTDQCWIWRGAKSDTGYGTFQDNKRTCRAHRWSWIRVNGDLLSTQFLDHTCHNRLCVNPGHLRVVSNKQNMENIKGAHVDSKSGVRGVSWHGPSNKWRTHVTHAGTKYSAGYFNDLHEAESAITDLRNQLFTHNLADRR